MSDADDLFMDYWIYHKVWEGCDPFDEDEEENEEQEQEQHQYYDNNSSNGNSREY